MHCLSAATVKSRFEYKRPGLFVLPVRVYRAAQAVDLPETAYYAGCRSWVELERELPTDGATPVLSDEAFGGAAGWSGCCGRRRGVKCETSARARRMRS